MILNIFPHFLCQASASSGLINLSSPTFLYAISEPNTPAIIAINPNTIFITSLPFLCLIPNFGASLPSRYFNPNTSAIEYRPGFLFISQPAAQRCREQMCPCCARYDSALPSRLTSRKSPNEPRQYRPRGPHAYLLCLYCAEHLCRSCRK